MVHIGADDYLIPKEVAAELAQLREENARLRATMFHNTGLAQALESRLAQARVAVSIASDLWHKINRTMADMQAGQFALDRALRALEEPR